MTWPNPDSRWLTDMELAAFDWRAELDRQGRQLAWLARQTDTKPRTVYSYSGGQVRPPLAWLRAAAIALGWAP